MQNDYCSDGARSTVRFGPVGAGPLFACSANDSQAMAIRCDPVCADYRNDPADSLCRQDALTGLGNRASFFEHLQYALRQAAAGAAPLAVLILDIDHFKLINNSLGHAVGDDMLTRAARRIVGSVGPYGMTARMGGDEFAIVLTAFGARSELSNLAENIAAQLLEPITCDGHVIHLAASIGIAVFPHGGGDAMSLLRNCETAMYSVKEKGRGDYRFYDDSLAVRAAGQLDLQNDLRRAADEEQFILHFQPKVLLADRSPMGCEALIRWRHPSGRMIAPGEFIPLAEDTGLIIPIGLWAMRAACEAHRDWAERGNGGINVAVNLSARQFRQPNLIEKIRDTLEEMAMSPEYLEIELTESTVMDDPEQAIRVMKRLRDIGIKISVDDFGTGYSSLGYLKKLPINSLKIDRTFISDLVTDKDDAAIVKMIISLGNTLNLGVIAEGIEHEDQVHFLENHGCIAGQGYLFAFPLSSHDYSEWMRQRPLQGNLIISSR